MKRPATLILAAVALLAAVVPVLGAAPATASTVPGGAAVTQDLVLPHRLAPQLGQDAQGNQTLVTGVPDGRGGLTQLLVRERPAGGAWGEDRALTAPSRVLSAPTLAVSDGGVAVVAWFRELGGAAFVRVRDESGQWGPTTRLAGIAPYGGLQVVVDPSGDTAAVAATQESGSVHVGVYRHGRWSVVRNPGYGTPSIALDEAGTLYAATSSVQRGGDGEVTLTRLSPSGHWSRAERVPGLGPKPQDVQVRVTWSGQVTLMVGYVDPRWRSTYDTESYYPTAYLVLRQEHRGAAWRRLWKRGGVVAVEPTLAPSGRLRLVYQQWLDRVGRRPTAIALRSVEIGGRGAGVPVTLDQQPTTRHRGGYDTTTAPDPRGLLRVWWRALPAVAGEVQPAGDLHAAALTPTRVLADDDLPGTGVADALQLGDLLQVTAAGGDAGWVQDPSYRNTTTYGAVVADGTVVVARD